MSCWRLLELSEQPDGEQIPQLLVKPVFKLDSYIVHLTDLSNIWSEELGPDGIVDRASEEQSPIEVSKQDTTQLGILLSNVEKPLQGFNEATCRITRSEEDDLVLHTIITLPKPLESLTWKFRLRKRTSITLKNELILPLLVSSHIQHGRITSLMSMISDKDKAITRLVDQYESSNLDLAAAFPSVSGLKAGRKGVKREQAAKHVPALQPFRETVWMEKTEQLQQSDVTTLSLFQEALAHSTPKVPPRLKSEESEKFWWTAVPDQLAPLKHILTDQSKKPVLLNKVVIESSEDETEDEFETHENFKTRIMASKSAKGPKPLPSSAHNKEEGSDDESTEDDEDLDAALISPSRKHSQASRKPPPLARSPTPTAPPASEVTPPSVTKPKGKKFRIGGNSKEGATASLSSMHENQDATSDDETTLVKETLPSSSQVDPQLDATPKKARRPFKIGGRGKVNYGNDSQRATSSSPQTTHVTATQPQPIEPPSSSPIVSPVKEETPIIESHEETPEEKAERKRAELKRKNEEAARKQAQRKKKKRF